MFIFLHCQHYSNWGKILVAIRRNSQDLKTPFLIPSLIIRFNLDHQIVDLDFVHEQIYESERSLNIRYDEHSAISLNNTSLFMNMNFERMTKSVSRLSTNLGHLAWSVKERKRQLDFLDDVAERYLVIAAKNGFDRAEAEEVKNQLLENQEYLRCWNKNVEERIEYLSKRAQQLVQTVSETYLTSKSTVSDEFIGVQWDRTARCCIIPKRRRLCGAR